MFLVLTTYIKSLSEIERFLPDHSAHLDRCYGTGKLIVSGRLEPRTGGFMLFDVSTREEVLAILDCDPFKRNACLDYRILELIPTKHAPEFGPFVHFLRMNGEKGG